jgi:hypothetical protein
VWLAFVLSYAGVALALVYLVAYSLDQWSHRADRTAGVDRLNVDAGRFNDASTRFTLVFMAGYWVALAAGVVVCTLLAQRGRNPARIILAVLAGVMAVSNLLSLGGVWFGYLLREQLANDPDNPVSAALQVRVPWWATAGTGVLAALALGILISLILPASNRYFSPGPGRRFATDH